MDRRITPALLVTMSLVLCAPHVFAQQKTLPLRLHNQHTIMWCWAASAAATIEYAKGARIEDCEVLSAYDRRRGGLGLCCQDPRPCLRGGVPGEIEAILGSIFDVHGRTEPSAPSLRALAKHIDGGGPVIAWLWNSSTSAHVVAITGYDLNRGRVYVLDPMRQAPLWVGFGWLKKNPMTGTWRDTLFVDGPPMKKVAVPVAPDDSADDDDGAPKKKTTVHGVTEDSADEGDPPPKKKAPVHVVAADDDGDDGDDSSSGDSNGSGDETRPQVAHWCCTPLGKFGPYPLNNVPVGAGCHWPVVGGQAFGIACN
jgi:hypothetical protein